MKNDPIHSPSHYTAGGIETIDYMRCKLSPAELRGYLRGNILKYVSRIGAKGGPDQAVEDAGKLAWYAARLAELDKPAYTVPATVVELDLSASLELAAPTLLRGAREHTLAAKLRKLREEVGELTESLDEYAALESPLAAVLAEAADVVIVVAQLAEMAHVPLVEKARKFASQLDAEEGRRDEG